MGWRAYDVAVFRWIVNRFGWPERVWDAFLAGYREVRRLSDAEMAAVPCLVAVREVWLAGMLAAAVGRWGKYRYQDRYWDRFFRTLREWHDGHLRCRDGGA